MTLLPPSQRARLSAKLAKFPGEYRSVNSFAYIGSPASFNGLAGSERRPPDQYLTIGTELYPSFEDAAGYTFHNYRSFYFRRLLPDLRARPPAPRTHPGDLSHIPRGNVPDYIDSASGTFPPDGQTNTVRNGPVVIVTRMDRLSSIPRSDVLNPDILLYYFVCYSRSDGRDTRGTLHVNIRSDVDLCFFFVCKCKESELHSLKGKCDVFNI